MIAISIEWKLKSKTSGTLTFFVGSDDGEIEGFIVGFKDGLDDGALDGAIDGILVGLKDGLDDGNRVGAVDGLEEGVAVGEYKSWTRNNMNHEALFRYIIHNYFPTLKDLPIS